MKYTSNQINSMTWQQWNEVMAKELTAAGFKGRNFIDGRWQDYGPVTAGDEPKYFISSVVTDVDRLNYLKELGLIDNGRCPMCGGKIVGTPGRYTNRLDRSYTHQICQNCVQTRGGLRKTPSNNNSQSSGCMVTLTIFIISVLGLLFI